MPANILFTNQEIEWLQSLMVAWFTRHPQNRDPIELGYQKEVYASITTANTLPPANATFSDKANEWLQLVVRWYLEELIVTYTDIEMAIGADVEAKLQAADTL